MRDSRRKLVIYCNWEAQLELLDGQEQKGQWNYYKVILFWHHENLLLRNIVGLDDSLARRQQAGYANKKLMKMSNEAKSRDYEAPELVFPVPYQMLYFSTYRVEALCKATLRLLLQFQTVKSRSSIY